MTRSIQKGPFSEVLLDNQDVTNQRVWSRRSLVLPKHIGFQLLIHNGRRFVRFKVKEEMVGHRFGEFALTRKKPIHRKTKKKSR